MKDNFDFYRSIVLYALPRANDIWQPLISGAKNNVVFAREAYGATYAFKFCEKNYAIRNRNVSAALRDAGIPAPEIIAQSWQNQWYEIYPVISGQTLYECVGNGITRTELTNIYKELLNFVRQMSEIDTKNIDFVNLEYAHQTARRDTTKTNGAIMGNLIGAVVRLMNIGSTSDNGLYHHGMTPKNIIISNRGQISGLLDIDETGICNINYALGVMLAKAKLLGLDTHALCTEYECITGQHLNHAHISGIIKIQNFGRNVLYRTKTK